MLPHFSHRLENEDIAVYFDIQQQITFHVLARSTQEIAGLRMAFAHYLALLGQIDRDLDKPIAKVGLHSAALQAKALAPRQGLAVRNLSNPQSMSQSEFFGALATLGFAIHGEEVKRWQLRLNDLNEQNGLSQIREFYTGKLDGPSFPIEQSETLAELARLDASLAVDYGRLLPLYVAYLRRGLSAAGGLPGVRAGMRSAMRPVAPSVPVGGGAWRVSHLGGVQVHLLDTRRLPLGLRGLSCLSLVERQEWRAIRSRTAARLFLASRAMALPMARAFDRRNRHIRRLPSGQPVLCHGHISISRCYPYVAFAFSPRPMGLDLERIRYDAGLIDGVATLFSAAEQEVLRHPATRASAFCRIWSRKEALAKQQGCGICTDLAALDTLHPSCRLHPSCHLHSRRLRGGYWLSLAC